MKVIALLNCIQWLKNLLILVPAFFFGEQWEAGMAVELLIAVLSFNLLTSAVYLINDLNDLASDKLHPEKCRRALASEMITAKTAVLMIVLLLLTGFTGFIFTGILPLLFAVIYFLMNVLYTFYLKQIPLIDLLILVSGYQLRLLIGGSIAHVPLTGWLHSLVFLLSVLLLLQKRRSDVLLYQEKGIILRATVPFYARLSLRKINGGLLWIIAGLYTTYVVHLILKDSRFLLTTFTVPLVFVGLYRTFQLMNRNPHRDILRVAFLDGWIWGTGLGWVLLFFITLYRWS